MTDLNKLFSPLFLSDTEIRKVIELIFFSYREFTSGPDKVLNKINFGRAHHRVIYFVGKKRQITIRSLLEILQIPEATAAAPGLVVGLLDQFVPALIAASIDDKVTSFILAGLSVTQLVFFAETGVLILRSVIPLNTGQLIAIFFLRTAIALPILALVAHLII